MYSTFVEMCLTFTILTQHVRLCTQHLQFCTQHLQLGSNIYGSKLRKQDSARNIRISNATSATLHAADVILALSMVIANWQMLIQFLKTKFSK